MSKDGVLFPKSKDTRLSARVLNSLRRVFTAQPAPGHPASRELPLNRWWASVSTFVVVSALGFVALANVISSAWITHVQMALIAVAAGLMAGVWTFAYITRSRTLLKRGFYAGAMLTLVAVIGYTFSIRISGLTKEPVDFEVGATPLEGWSIVGALAIVVLLFMAMLHESRNP